MNDVDIALDDNTLVRSHQSRAFLHSLGVEGEILVTRGHSHDSITLILDSGAAFIGDLPPVPISDDRKHPTMLGLERIRAQEVR